MRRLGVLLAATAAGWLLGPGAAVAANPIVVVLSPATQTVAATAPACVAIGANDSVTNEALAVDIILDFQVLTIPPSSPNRANFNAPAKTDATGKGVLCVDRREASTMNVLLEANGILVHGSPDYATTGTSNTVRINWSPAAVPPTPQGPTLTVSAAVSPTSAIVGDVVKVDVTIAAGGTATALAPSLEIKRADDTTQFISASIDGGSCGGTADIACTTGDIAVGGRVEAIVSLKATALGKASMALVLRWHSPPNPPVTTTPGNPDVSASVAFEITQPVANLSVRLPLPKARQVVGKPWTAVAIVTNGGPNGAGGSAVAFSLPAGVRLTALSSPGATCSRRALTCTFNPFAAATTARVMISLIPTSPGRRALVVRTKVAGASDPGAGNNVARLAVTAYPAVAKTGRT